VSVGRILGIALGVVVAAVAVALVVGLPIWPASPEANCGDPAPGDHLGCSASMP
jgi:hypothetical protein